MPLPLGHAAIGAATYEISGGSSAFGRWKRFVYIVLLANLPDIDVLIGLLLRWNGNAFHRGPTHSLVFAVSAGCLAFYAGRRWFDVPGISRVQCTLLVLSHVLADLLFTDSPVSFFWPLESNWSTGDSGWVEVVHSIVFESFGDGWIVLGCAAAIVFWRLARWSLTPVRTLPHALKK
jgi:hypothetical protein